MKLYEAGLN